MPAERINGQRTVMIGRVADPGRTVKLEVTFRYNHQTAEIESVQRVVRVGRRQRLTRMSVVISMDVLPTRAKVAGTVVRCV